MINWSSDFTKATTTSILSKLDQIKTMEEFVLIDHKTLEKYFNDTEIKLINEIFKINPNNYGFKIKFLGFENIPNNLIAIKNQQYSFRQKIHNIPTQYLSKPIFRAYQKMNQAIFSDLNKKLLVKSGYRSLFYQSLIFLHFHKLYNFDLNQTLKRVTIPGYSEHCSPTNQAIDFITQNGLPSEEKPLNFTKSIEYRWLNKNANKFGFEKSYPKNNQSKIMFEPWHWRFK